MFPDLRRSMNLDSRGDVSVELLRAFRLHFGDAEFQLRCEFQGFYYSGVCFGHGFLEKKQQSAARSRLLWNIWNNFKIIAAPNNISSIFEQKMK